MTYNDVQQIRSKSKVTQQYERGEFISSRPYLEVCVCVCVCVFRYLEV